MNSKINEYHVLFQNLEDFFHAIVLNLSPKRNENIERIARLIEVSCLSCNFVYDILGLMTAAQLKKVSSYRCHQCGSNTSRIVFLDITDEEKQLLLKDSRFTSRLENLEQIEDKLSRDQIEQYSISVKNLLETTFKMRKQGYCLNDKIKQSVENKTCSEFTDYYLKLFSKDFEMAYDKRPFENDEFIVAMYTGSFFMTNKYLYLRKANFYSIDSKPFDFLINLSKIQSCELHGRYFKNLVLKYDSGEEQSFRIGFSQILPELKFIETIKNWYNY